MTIFSRNMGAKSPKKLGRKENDHDRKQDRSEQVLFIIGGLRCRSLLNSAGKGSDTWEVGEEGMEGERG